MSFRLTSFSALLLAGLTITTTPTIMAQETKDTDPIGYFLGVSVGQQMASQGFKNGDFDVEGLAQGLLTRWQERHRHSIKKR